MNNLFLKLQEWDQKRRSLNKRNILARAVKEAKKRRDDKKEDRLSQEYKFLDGQHWGAYYDYHDYMIDVCKSLPRISIEKVPPYSFSTSKENQKIEHAFHKASSLIAEIILIESVNTNSSRSKRTEPKSQNYQYGLDKNRKILIGLCREIEEIKPGGIGFPPTFEKKYFLFSEQYSLPKSKIKPNLFEISKIGSRQVREFVGAYYKYISEEKN